MEDIEFDCPQCGQHLEAPPEMAGETVPCPACEAELLLPGGAEPTQTKVPTCPKCGADIPENAVLCVNCGFHLDLGRTLRTRFS